MTKISIITICYNNLDDVLGTCKSLDEQKRKPFEHLIINGSTNKEIENYFSSIENPAFRKIINERDKGIADAFNKGIKMASGDIILLLNSGDFLYDDNVTRIVSEQFEKDKDLMWLHGKYRTIRSDIWVILGKPFEKEKVYRGMRSISHQTMYVKKELYTKHGYYDSQYKIAMDFDFLVRIRNEKFIFLPEILATFQPGGVSSTQYYSSLKENAAIIQKYFGYSWKNKCWNFRLKTLKRIQNIPFVGKLLYRIKAGLGLSNA